MGDADGGVTLKIDADTAAYITKIAKLADHHEKVTKHTEEWGEAFGHVLDHAAAMLTPLAAIEAASEGIRDVIEEWEKKLEKASQTSSTLVDKLRQTTAATGESREAVSEQLIGTRSPLSVAERQSAFSAFRDAAPGSARTIGAAAVVGGASKAQIAGFDPTQFSGVAGNLYDFAGSQSFDVAQLLYSRLGASQAGSAAERLRFFGEKVGPDQAKSLLPYLIASFQAGDRKLSFLNSAVGDYRPGMGPLDAYLGNSRARFQNPTLYGQIASHLPGAQRDVSSVGGLLDRSAAAALEDPEVARRERIRLINADTEVGNFGRRADYAEGKEEERALNEFAANSHGFGVSTPFTSSVARALGNKSSGQSWRFPGGPRGRSRATSRRSAGHTERPPPAPRTSKRINTDAHSEGSSMSSSQWVATFTQTTGSTPGIFYFAVAPTRQGVIADADIARSTRS
jgi:hypothetical protein